MDKDNDAPTDDYIGKFQTTVAAGTKEVQVEGPVLRRFRGNFWLKVDTHSVFSMSTSLKPDRSNPLPLVPKMQQSIHIYLTAPSVTPVISRQPLGI